MRETLKNIYDAYYPVRLATWFGLAGAALLLFWLEDGFPPPIWILLWQTLHSFLSLWKTQGAAILLPIAMILFISLLWLMAWIVLIRACLLVWRHHRGLRMRQERKAAWQTTRQIAELDAFALPGAHTLTLPVLNGEDDQNDLDDQNNGESSVALRPPIRLPQYATRSTYSTAIAQETLRPSLHASHTSQGMHRESRVYTSSVASANISSVAIEDIPTTPEPSSLSSSLPSSLPRTSPHRTLRLDTSAHTPAISASKPRGRATQATSASLEAAVGWHPGLTRQRNPNEDSVVVLRGMCTYREQLVPFGLFVVADGMGGHACGQEASRIAIRTLAQVALRDLMQPEGAVTRDDAQLVELLTRAVEQANAAIYQRGQEQGKDMGTTLTAALIVDTREAVMAYVVNAGDSRTYLLGKGERLQQITRDHSLVANLVAAGAITPDAVYTHPERKRRDRLVYPRTPPRRYAAPVLRWPLGNGARPRHRAHSTSR